MTHPDGRRPPGASTPYPDPGYARHAPSPRIGELRRAPPPYGALLALLCAGLGTTILFQIGWRAVVALAPDVDVVGLFRLQDVLRLALTIATTASIALVWSRMEDRAARGALGVALVLFVVESASWAIRLPEMLGGGGLFGESPLGDVLAFAGVVFAGAGDIALFHGLALRARTAGVARPQGGTAGFATVRLLRLALAGFMVLLPASMRPEFLLDPSVRTGLAFFQLALAAGCVVWTVVLVQRLRVGPVSPAEGAAPSLGIVAAGTPVPDSASRDLVVGLVALAVGGVVTLGTYGLAASAGGGRYLIATGPFVYGIFRIGRALFRRS